MNINQGRCDLAPLTIVCAHGVGTKLSSVSNRCADVLYTMNVEEYLCLSAVHMFECGRHALFPLFTSYHQLQQPITQSHTKITFHSS